MVRAQSIDCATVLDASREAYFEGRLDRAIETLDQCLGSNGIPLEDRVEAYRILGLCYVAKDQESDARTAIHQILLLEPEWFADPAQNTPAFLGLVESVRQSMLEGRLVSPDQTPQSGGRKWWILGGLAAAGGAVVLALLGGGDDESDPDLPAPPTLPDR